MTAVSPARGTGPEAIEWPAEARYDVLLVVGSDASERSREELSQLLASLDRQNATCCVVLVVRGNRPLGGLDWPANVTLHRLAAPRVTSLSRSRNLGLAFCRQAELLSRSVVIGFPDDDCAYPPGLLDGVLDRVAGGAQMVCTAIGPTVREVDPKRFPAQAMDIGTDLVMSALNSGTMFLETDLAAEVGDFDERLGLGARFGAGEDSDFMIRAARLARAAVYDPKLVVLHPYKAHRHAQYFPGNVAVLAKHALGPSLTLGALMRRLAVGLLLLGRGELGVRAYLAGLRAALLMVGVRGRTNEGGSVSV